MAGERKNLQPAISEQPGHKDMRLFKNKIFIIPLENNIFTSKNAG
jgi:hypothetical protein